MKVGHNVLVYCCSRDWYDYDWVVMTYRYDGQTMHLLQVWIVP